MSRICKREKKKTAVMIAYRLAVDAKEAVMPGEIGKHVFNYGSWGSQNLKQITVKNSNTVWNCSANIQPLETTCIVGALVACCWEAK